MAQFNQKEDYLEALKIQIRCKKARNFVSEEIGQHIEDQKASYRNEGDNEALAEEKALEQMGDPIEVGKQLDRIHRPRMEWLLLLAVLALCCLGILAQLSLGDFVKEVTLPNSVNVERHIIFLVIGFLLMATIYFVDYSFIGKYSKVLCFLFIVGFFLFAPFDTRVNGSLRYLHAYGLLFIPIYGGLLYAYRKNGYVGITICLLISIFSSMIEMQFVAQSSVYLGVLLSSLIMLSVAVMKNWFGTSKKISMAVIWGWIPIIYGILALSGISIFGEYQRMRLENFFNTILRTGYYDLDYQIERARAIISQAKLFGGNNDVTTNYLPGYNTEYILTYVIRRWGIAAGMLIIVLFIVIIGRMIYLSYHQKNSLGMFVGLGCSMVFALQGSIYILSNLGFQFVAQVNLPFVSFGGSSLLTNFIILGLMLSIFRNTYTMKEVPYTKKYAFKIERLK